MAVRADPDPTPPRRRVVVDRDSPDGRARIVGNFAVVRATPEGDRAFIARTLLGLMGADVDWNQDDLDRLTEMLRGNV